MGIEIAESRITQSKSGNCWVGMTEQKAKDTNLDFIFKEFKQLDRDRDKVLSLDEIMREYRKKQKRINNVANVALTYCGIRALSELAVLKAPPELIKTLYQAANKTAPSIRTLFIATAFWTNIAALIKLSANKIKGENEVMIAQYHKDVEEQNKD